MSDRFERTIDVLSHVGGGRGDVNAVVDDRRRLLGQGIDLDTARDEVNGLRR